MLGDENIFKPIRQLEGEVLEKRKKFDDLKQDIEILNLKESQSGGLEGSDREKQKQLLRQARETAEAIRETQHKIAAAWNEIKSRHPEIGDYKSVSTSQNIGTFQKALTDSEIKTIFNNIDLP